MKTFIFSAIAGSAGVTDKKFVKKDGSGNVVDNAAPADAVGVSNATKTSGKSCGVIMEGFMKLTAVAGTYKFGEALELAADGQSLQAITTGDKVAMVAEPASVVLAAPGELQVYLKM